MSPLLAALAARRIFVLYKLVPRNNGRTDKVPINPATGGNSDAQDESTWMFPAIALSWAAYYGAGYGVGIAFRDPNGLFVLDLDGCVIDGALTPTAQKLVAQFAGCYIEYSQSGTGLHIFGSYVGTPPTHTNKNSELHIELYSARRFIALTGALLAPEHNDALKDATDQLWAVALSYFQPKAVDRLELTDAAIWPVVGVEAVKRIKPRFAQLLGGERLLNDASSQDLEFVCYALEAFGGNCKTTLEWLESDHGYAFSPAKAHRMDYYLPRTILEALARLNADPVVNVKFGGDLPAGASLVKQPGAAVVVAGELPEGSPLVMNRKMQFEATLPAIAYTLERFESNVFGFDEFRDCLMVKAAGTDAWLPISDIGMIELREYFERVMHFAPVSKDAMRDALELVASRNKFDSAITWLNGLTWDGVPRLDRFLTTYCGTVDDEYTRAVSTYIWTGMAARVLDPGCQLDMVVAFQSPQGKMKSTGFQAMVPTDDCFTDGLSLHEDDDDFKRLLRGKLLIEVAEMAGLSKADIGLVKRVITRRVEEWIEKFKTHPTRFKRRCMLFASTNEPQFLPPDETGHRRWLPVEVTQLDRARIGTDRDQLWAEGAFQWKARREALGIEHGVAWADAERLAAGRHAKYEQTDIWETVIERWLESTSPSETVPPKNRPIALNEVLIGAIGLGTSHHDTRAEKRVSRVLRQLGYESRPVRVDGKQVKRWVLKS